MRCVLSSDSPPIRYELSQDLMVIGRTGADLTVADPDVSRRHATVEKRAGTVVLRDLKSTNGTRVNDEEVTERVLSDGDRLSLAGVDLVFRIGQ